MKIHNDFTLYWRVIPSGKRVVYYYDYDGDDRRLGGWWEWETCAYLKKRRSLTQAYADTSKKNLKNPLLPYFGPVLMHRITRDDVGNWLDSLIERDYQNTSINGYLGTFKTMMIEAEALA
jgi:hypothetical protein